MEAISKKDRITTFSIHLSNKNLIEICRKTFNSLGEAVQFGIKSVFENLHHSFSITNNSDFLTVYSKDFVGFYISIVKNYRIPQVEEQAIEAAKTSGKSELLENYKNSEYIWPLSYIYEDILSINQHIITIPSKRNPSISQDMGNVVPNSHDFHKEANLVYYLFYSKNQPLDSNHFKNYYELSQVFKEISGGYSFDIVYTQEKANERLKLNLRFSSQHEKWFDAEQSGLGLRDLLVILSYIILLDKKIILLEEPENHLHAELQRKLLNFFKQNPDKQFIITTHSNVFLDSTYVDRIFQTSMENGKIIVNDTTTKAGLLQDLGYSVFDNLLADLVILVEGKNDKPVLEELLLKMGVWGKYNIKIWILAGSNMIHQDLSIVVSSSNVIAIIDQEPESSSDKEIFKQICQESNVDVTILERYSLENYFTLDALKSVHKDKPPIKTQKLHSLTEIQPEISLFNQIDEHLGKRNIEHKLVAKEMKIADIQGTDLYTFLEKVKTMCEKNSTNS